MFAGEHLVGLEEGVGFFVFGVVFFGFLNGFGGELGDGEGVGGAGDHDLEHVKVFSEADELGVHGVGLFL